MYFLCVYAGRWAQHPPIPASWSPPLSDYVKLLTSLQLPCHSQRRGIFQVSQIFFLLFSPPSLSPIPICLLSDCIFKKHCHFFFFLHAPFHLPPPLRPTAPVYVGNYFCCVRGKVTCKRNAGISGLRQAYCFWSWNVLQWLSMKDSWSNKVWIMCAAFHCCNNIFQTKPLCLTLFLLQLWE